MIKSRDRPFKNSNRKARRPHPPIGTARAYKFRRWTHIVIIFSTNSNEMDDARSVVDAPPSPPPPWMLVESTGDSEIDAGIRHASDYDNDDDGDDAQSCICDESGDFDPDSLRDLCFRSVDEDRKDEMAPPEKAEDELRGFWRNCGGGDEEQILCHKSSASVDSTEEEKNKLFWEACLAS